MIAWDDGRIGCAHHRYTFLHGDSTVVSQPTAPCLGPAIVGCRIGEKAADTGVGVRVDGRLAEAAEGQCEIGAVLRHVFQKTLNERQVVGLVLKQAELASDALGVGRLEAGPEAVERLIRLLDGGLLVFVKERQERFREPGEIPPGDTWLVAIG